MKTPLQHTTGKAYFMDFEFNVNEDTFIPRPETELLVEKAVESLRGTPSKGMSILDIGTGSGNIAISLTKYIQQSRIVALDISYKALEKARANAVNNGVSDRIRFIQSDLFDGLLPGVLFDMVISNPPYVSKADMVELPGEVQREPYVALYGGIDGLDFYRAIADKVTGYLKEHGILLMEVGYDQALDVKRILEKKPFKQVEIFKDYSGIDRIIKAQNG